ncbi:MAG: hypothetical protein H0V49_08700 [Nocardioidaceae bacterium]|nr:hypothetical protein [Nocardioidaceae bacterium]
MKRDGDPARSLGAEAGPPGGRFVRLHIGAAASWVIFWYAAALLGYLAVNAMAARLLADSFAQFILAITVSTMLGQLGLMGVHRGGMRQAARLDVDNLEGLQELRRDARVVSCLLLPVTGTIAGGVTFALTTVSRTAERVTLAVLMGLLVWLGGQQKLSASYLRGFGQVRFASLLEGLSGGALVAACQGVLMATLLVFAPDSGLVNVFAAMATGYVAPVAVASRRVTPLWRHLEETGSVLRDARLVTIRHWYFASTLLGGYLNGVVEVWLATAVLSSSGASLFAAAQRLTGVLTVPLAAVAMVFAPAVARLSKVDDRRLEMLLRTGATFAAVAMAVFWIPLLVIPGPVLRIVYGPHFGSASTMLLLLALGSASNVLAGMCGMALTMSRHERLVARVMWCAVVVRVGVGGLLGAVFGGVGLAAGAAAVTIVVSAVLWMLANLRMGLRTHLTVRPSLRVIRETPG